MLEAPVFAGTHFILGVYLPYNIMCKKINDIQEHGTLARNSTSEPECGLYVTRWARWSADIYNQQHIPIFLV